MSVSRLLEKLSYTDHESLIKQSVVSREKKEYRRALQMLANPETAYHGTPAGSLPNIFIGGELVPGSRALMGDKYGKGVYFGVGLPAADYYPLNSAMLATNNKLRSIPLIPKDALLGDQPGSHRYYWTNTPDPVSISNNKTTLILPSAQHDFDTNKFIETNYSGYSRYNKLRTIPRNTFKKAFEATHPELADSMYRHQAKPSGTNRVIGRRTLEALNSIPASRILKTEPSGAYGLPVPTTSATDMPTSVADVSRVETPTLRALVSDVPIASTSAQDAATTASRVVTPTTTTTPTTTPRLTTIATDMPTTVDDVPRVVTPIGDAAAKGVPVVRSPIASRAALAGLLGLGLGGGALALNRSRVKRQLNTQPTG
jgi:hypothetical protein